MKVALLIIGIILFLGALFFLVRLTRSFIKDPVDKTGNKKFYFRYGGSILALSVGLALLIAALFFFHPEWGTLSAYPSGVYAGETISYPLNISLAICGAFLFAGGMGLLWSLFAIRYYKRAFDEMMKKNLSLIMFLSIPVALIGFFVMMEGLGPYFEYPLINGFCIDGDGFHWTRAGVSYSGFHLAWYGVVILFGVAVCYWICDHRFYQKYHKHGMLDAVVLFGFPAGIIGARVWYVVGNFEREFAGESWTKVFEIWNGGLTILGGAFFGIVVGYIVLRVRHKEVDWRWAIDTILPTILLAQAIGRWGNFFNVEVYGEAVEANGIWSLLPNWIAQQMGYSNNGTSLGVGYIHVPLYLIEGLLNIAGYFLLAYGAKKALRKYLVPGDIAAGYFLWYGVVRLILEPFRDSKFNMGADNAWSICNAIVYIAIGLILIAGFHLHGAYRKKGNPLPLCLSSLVFLIPAFFFPLLNSLNRASSKDGTGVTSSFTGFEVMGKSPLHIAAYCLLIAALVSVILAIALAFFRKDLFKYFLYVGSGLSLLAAAFLLLGKDASGLGDSSSYLTLSYGFVLMALCALGSALMGVTHLLACRNAGKTDIALSDEEKAAMGEQQ